MSPAAPKIQPRPAVFPTGFTWGVATAATQIEGGATAEGKGPSIWDTFARQPHAIAGGDTPEFACDHYHRYRDDFALMADLGVKHHRFSIAWSRILPFGLDRVNPQGLDFYHRLIDAMLERGITPWATMYHWDLPQALEDKGGWRVRTVVDAFADYADEIVRTYGDRVKHWMTLNEISCFIEKGYRTGRHAPGRRDTKAEVEQAYHHALLCHGHGVRAVREHGGPGARVGLADNTTVAIPLTETPADIAAAAARFAKLNQRVLGSLQVNASPAAARAESRPTPPWIQPGDLELITQPADFLGMNLYTGGCVRAGRDGQPEPVPYPDRFPTADSPWLRLNARCLYWGPRLAAEVYGIKSIVISENGAGYDEPAIAANEVFDLHRLEYIRACLRELKRGIDDGVPVDGYFVWSFLDNFEWADGYARRFGIVHNDFAQQVRRVKASGRWFGEVIRNNTLI